jgi:hypothetical protein
MVSPTGGGEDEAASVASSQEISAMTAEFGAIAGGGGSDDLQARSNSVPADMYMNFGDPVMSTHPTLTQDEMMQEQQHLMQEQHQLMPEQQQLMSEQQHLMPEQQLMSELTGQQQQPEQAVHQLLEHVFPFWSLRWMQDQLMTLQQQMISVQQQMMSEMTQLQQ